MTSRRPKVLGRRTLNRTLLARQSLLSRASNTSPSGLLEATVGIQAQSPQAPYVGLWCRIEDFRPQELSQLIEGRKAVRMALMRSTIHLVTARDCLRLRPVVQPVIEASLRSSYGKVLEGVDRRRLSDVARTLVEEQPLTHLQLGTALAKRWSSREPNALAMAARAWLPLVQVPPRGLWERSGPAAHTTAEAWLGRPLGAPNDPGPLLMRYLAAFGPASVRDMQVWSGLTGLRQIVERMRSRLRVFKDEQGNQLFDPAEAELGDPDLPAPVRFLPEYDNTLLSHANRDRVIEAGVRERIFTRGGVLVDGFALGAWRLRKAKRVRLEIEMFERVPRSHRNDLEAEAHRLAAFFAQDGEAPEIELLRNV